MFFLLSWSILLLYGVFQFLKRRRKLCWTETFQNRRCASKLKETEPILFFLRWGVNQGLDSRQLISEMNGFANTWKKNRVHIFQTIIFSLMRVGVLNIFTLYILKLFINESVASQLLTYLSLVVWTFFVWILYFNLIRHWKNLDLKIDLWPKVIGHYVQCPGLEPIPCEWAQVLQQEQQTGVDMSHERMTLFRKVLNRDIDRQLSQSRYFSSLLPIAELGLSLPVLSTSAVLFLNFSHSH